MVDVAAPSNPMSSSTSAACLASSASCRMVVQGVSTPLPRLRRPVRCSTETWWRILARTMARASGRRASLSVAKDAWVRSRRALAVERGPASWPR